MTVRTMKALIVSAAALQDITIDGKKTSRLTKNSYNGTLHLEADGVELLE